MFEWRKKSKKESTSFEWEDKATQSLEAAVSQSPVPAMLKQQIKKKLSKAAEQEASNAGRKNVTPEDLMKGLMANLPAEMRNKVEQAAQKGPQGLADLQKDLEQKK